MEGFEHVRMAATRLHEDVVAAEASALCPDAMVAGAVAHLELELYFLPSGDPALKGARAVFDEQSGTICCEETEDPGERAELVTHEIGHSVLHAGAASCTSTDVDASRTVESAPVGLQRVEDYGARERRELQANVFAREFLLPKQQARHLYLSERLSASQIAETTGLPKNLVRQQLFDALLLPSPPSGAESTTALSMRKDDSQDRAAQHRGSAFQLQAGPGTGKTRTLVKAVVSLLRDGVHPSSILILTFSNRASGELSERISKAVGTDAAQIWIGTFHAFGLDLIRRFHDRLDLPEEPRLFDRSDAVEVLEEILPTLPLKHYRNLWDPVIDLREMITAISRAKDELTGPDDYCRLAQEMLERASDEDEQIAAEKCLEVGQVYQCYEEALSSHKSVDFGDLVMKPALLLESDQIVRTSVQFRHRHIFVDEYQDVNRASARLVKAVAGDGRRLWVVGDARQSIYRFRGASSSNMAIFSQDYPGAEADSLKVSYRSTTEIVRTIEAIAPHMGASAGMLPLSLESRTGETRWPPEVRHYADPDDEASGIAASIRELESNGIALRDQAVLCRTHQRLNDIAGALERRDIPVLHLGSLFERDEIRDLLSLLSLAIDSFGDGLARVGAMGRYRLSLQDVYLATRHYRQTKFRSLSDLEGVSGLSDLGQKGVRQLVKDLDGIFNKTAWEFLSTYLLDRSGILREIAEDSSVSKAMRGIALWQFLNFARATPPVKKGHPIRRVLDRVRQLVLFAEERDLRQVPPAALHVDAVRLMTVHGSKGLEFEAVHIPGLTKASFPSSFRGQRCTPPDGMVAESTLSVADYSRQSHEHEEECLFFVAASRARSRLLFHLPTQTSTGRNRAASPFLDWLDSRVVSHMHDPPRMPEPPHSDDVDSVDVQWAEGVSLTDQSIRSYDSCPLRFFYTHVLGLGGAKKPTAFTRTHDCIYTFVEWLTKERRGRPVSLEQAEESFDSIWEERGPIDHAFAADYRRLASSLIRTLIHHGEGKTFRDVELLMIELMDGRIALEPAEVIARPDGSTTLRKIRTGKTRKDEHDRLEHALFQIAGKAEYGALSGVEVLSLTDGEAVAIELSGTKLDNKRKKIMKMVADIGNGRFPASTDQFTCPRCPHFFHCPSVPTGPVSIDSSSK